MSLRHGELMRELGKKMSFDKVRDYGVSCHFQQYFSHILDKMVVSFIGGGHQRTPLTCCKSLTTEREVLCKFVTSLQFTTNYKGYVQNDNEFPFNFKKGPIVKVSSSHIHSVTNVW
jgi:hypothetical protein